jgi:hypothetical protein
MGTGSGTWGFPWASHPTTPRQDLCGPCGRFPCGSGLPSTRRAVDGQRANQARRIHGDPPWKWLKRLDMIWLIWLEMDLSMIFCDVFFGWCGDSIGHMGIWTYRWDSDRIVRDIHLDESCEICTTPGPRIGMYFIHQTCESGDWGLGCLHLVILVRQGPQTRTSRRKESNWKNWGAGTGLSGCGKHGGNHQILFHRLMSLMGIESYKHQAMSPQNRVYYCT